jgi:hypothetical protein
MAEQVAALARKRQELEQSKAQGEAPPPKRAETPSSSSLADRMALLEQKRKELDALSKDMNHPDDEGPPVSSSPATEQQQAPMKTITTTTTAVQMAEPEKRAAPPKSPKKVVSATKDVPPKSPERVSSAKNVAPPKSPPKSPSKKVASPKKTVPPKSPGKKGGWFGGKEEEPAKATSLPPPLEPEKTPAFQKVPLRSVNKEPESKEENTPEFLKAGKARLKPTGVALDLAPPQEGEEPQEDRSLVPQPEGPTRRSTPAVAAPPTQTIKRVTKHDGDYEIVEYKCYCTIL